MRENRKKEKTLDIHMIHVTTETRVENEKVELD
jgi:hypothetical protein